MGRVRHRLADALLIGFLIAAAVPLGGTVYQMLVIIPEWSQDLPGSLVRLFQGTSWAEAQARFWMHPIELLYPLLLIGALIASWPNRLRRRWLLICTVLLIGVTVWTGLYFVPKGVVPLMVQAGAGMTPEEITARAEAWIFWDRVRFVVIVLAYLAGLLALRIQPRSEEDAPLD